MRKRKGYRAETVELTTLGPTEMMVCEAHPHLGVMPIPREVGDDYAALAGWYWVYHLPSATIAASVEGEAGYLGLVEALGRVPGLEAEAPSRPVLEAALQAVRDYKDSLVPKPRKVAEVEPVALEPVYAPGVTPKNAVKAADAEVAALIGRGMAGDRTVTPEVLGAAIDKALHLAEGELLMAEIKQVLASPDELPTPPYYLVDGTPCNWEGWKVEYRELVRTGNALQVVAFNLIEVAERLLGGEKGRDINEEYRALNKQWLWLIAEGWRHWGRAVSHYLASPPVRQQQVQEKLGYIGNRERGWGELGKKTFLRHPEIAEASKLRRLVDDTRNTG